MASYEEIRNLFEYSDLKNKVVTATIIAAQELASTASPTAADKKWISEVFNNPASEGKKTYIAVLAANKSATVAQIQGASDAAIQTQVDAIVPILVSAMSGV